MFDVEAVFIFPWAVKLERLEPLGVFGLVEMIVFVAILTLGLVYAWRKGVLRRASSRRAAFEAPLEPLTWLLNYCRKYSWMFQWGLAGCAI